MPGTSVRREAGGGRLAGGWVRVVTIAAILVASVLARLPTFRIPLDQDGSVFAYVAKVWSEGGVPYRDIWDHKPPLIYLACRAVLGLAPASPGSVNVALRVAAAACDALAAVLLAVLVWRAFGAAAGVVAGLACGLFLAAPGIEREAFQTEHLVLLFVTGGFLAAWVYAETGRYVYAALSGLLFGVALVAKQVAGPPGVAVWAWLTWDVLRREGRPGLRRVVAHSLLLLAGAVLPCAVFAGYFALRGALRDFWFCTYTYNVLYASQYRKGALLGGLARLVHVKAFEHGLLWAAASAGAVFALCGRRTRRVGVLVALWIAAALLGLFLPGQFASCYYLPTIPPLAAGAGVGMVALWRLVRGSGLEDARTRLVSASVFTLVGGWVLGGFVQASGRLPDGVSQLYLKARVAAVAPVAIAAALLVGGLWMLVRGWRRAVRVGFAAVCGSVLLGLLGTAAVRERGHYLWATSPERTDAVVARVARELGAATRPGDRLYVWGSRPQIYVLSGRRSVSPYLYNFSYGLDLKRAFAFRKDHRVRTMAGLRRHEPPFIVLTETKTLSGFPELARFLDQRYVFERKWSARPYSLLVYRRNAPL